MPDLLKDEIGETFIGELGCSIKCAYADFDEKAFAAEVFDCNWDSLELKQRVRRVSVVLRRCLPVRFVLAVQILENASSRFSGLQSMVFPDFVELYGLDDWEVSMAAHCVFTRLCSSEFGMRPFIENDPDRAFKQLEEWGRSEDEHLRRLASECCRPLLPWGKRISYLTQNPKVIIAVLDLLVDDESNYVAKSVANNLNDISKLDPELALRTAKRWQGRSQRGDWIVKHALRTLLKQGNSRALAMFGYADPKSYQIAVIELSASRVKIGNAIKFEFQLETSSRQLGMLRLEYAIAYRKKNGTLSEKVFKISESNVCQATKTWQRSQSFRDLSTRKHYVGEHQLTVIANGRRMKSVGFELVD